VIALYFPYNLEAVFEPNIVKRFAMEWKDASQSNTAKISKECERINEEQNSDKKAIFSMVIGEDSISPRRDLAAACYKYNPDTLVLGSKGLAHSLTQHISQTFQKTTGSVADYCVHNAPCDVFVVRSPHEY